MRKLNHSYDTTRENDRRYQKLKRRKSKIADKYNSGRYKGDSKSEILDKKAGLRGLRLSEKYRRKNPDAKRSDVEKAKYNDPKLK